MLIEARTPKLKHKTNPISHKHELHRIKPNFLELHHHIKKHHALKHEEKIYTEHFKNDAHKYDKQFKSLNSSQRDAIRAYKGKDYTAINNYLRKGDISHADAAKWAGHLKDSIKHFKAKTDMVAIRGIAARSEWIKENCVTGANIQDKGFMSVSTRPATVADYATAKKIQDSNRQSVIMKLHIPKGTNIMPISPSVIGDKEHANLENQCEYLMHDNSNWSVHNVKHAKIGDTHVIVLDMHYKENKNG